MIVFCLMRSIIAKRLSLAHRRNSLTKHLNVFGVSNDQSDAKR